MNMNNKAKGTRCERTIAMLEAAGYQCMQAAHRWEHST